MREEIRNRLIGSVRGKRPPHALILAGMDTAGAYLLARDTAAAFCTGEADPGKLGSCPDFRETAGEALSVKQAREIISDLSMTGVQGKDRCVLIRDAHRMSAAVQNTLLKIIEEPPDGVLLLLTGNETGILQTIRSRCMIVRIGGEEPERIRQELIRQGKPERLATLCAGLSDGIYGDAVRFSQEEYLEFRTGALRALEGILFGTAPFQEIRALVSVAGGSDGSESNPEEDADGQGKKKKKKPDIGRTQDLLNIWQSVFRDALWFGAMEEGGEPGAEGILNRDAEGLVRNVSARLPSKTIQSIIEMLLNAQETLSNGGYPTAVLDALTADIIRRETV